MPLLPLRTACNRSSTAPEKTQDSLIIILHRQATGVCHETISLPAREILKMLHPRITKLRVDFTSSSFTGRLRNIFNL